MTTRAALENALLRQVGKKYALVGLDATTSNGTNVDLTVPILVGLESLGCVPSNPLAVSDADLARVATGNVGQLLAVATLAALEVVLANWDQPDQTADTDNSQSLGKLYDSIERTVTRLRQQVERLYGLGLALGSVQAGFYDLALAETIDPLSGVPN